ncbi:ImmA/IrrE family metallo-endopeptidase [Enterococcus alishanensis]
MDDVEKLMCEYPEIDYKFEKIMPKGQKGLYINNVIYLNPNQTHFELKSTVGEEIGHHLTTVGDITKQETPEERKQEETARNIGSVLSVTPQDFINAYKERIYTKAEAAEFIGVTRETLDRAINTYAVNFPTGMGYKNYLIFFQPNGVIGVFDYFNK